MGSRDDDDDVTYNETSTHVPKEDHCHRSQQDAIVMPGVPLMVMDDDDLTEHTMEDLFHFLEDAGAKDAALEIVVENPVEKSVAATIVDDLLDLELCQISTNTPAFTSTPSNESTQPAVDLSWVADFDPIASSATS